MLRPDCFAPHEECAEEDDRLTVVGIALIAIIVLGLVLVDKVQGAKEWMVATIRRGR